MSETTKAMQVDTSGPRTRPRDEEIEPEMQPPAKRRALEEATRVTALYPTYNGNDPMSRAVRMMYDCLSHRCKPPCEPMHSLLALCITIVRDIVFRIGTSERGVAWEMDVMQKTEKEATRKRENFEAMAINIDCGTTHSRMYHFGQIRKYVLETTKDDLLAFNVAFEMTTYPSDTRRTFHSEYLVPLSMISTVFIFLKNRGNPYKV